MFYQLSDRRTILKYVVSLNIFNYCYYSLRCNNNYLKSVFALCPSKLMNSDTGRIFTGGTREGITSAVQCCARFARCICCVAASSVLH